MGPNNASSALHAVLDSAMAEAAAPGPDAPVDAQPLSNGRAGDAAADLEAKLYEEHVARLQAENSAQDKKRRLMVAQQQLAEYATQQADDAAVLLQQMQALADLVTGATASPDVAKRVAEMQDALKQTVGEANAFATQQRTDVERLKRSSAQAGLQGGTASGDAKRGTEEVVETDTAEAMEAGDGDAIVDAPTTSADFSERAKYIPMRLSMAERRYLRLLEAALSVSEYTDKVDILTWRHRNGRVHAQIKDICSILSGLMVAMDYAKGQKLVVDRNFADNAQFFQNVFEVGRRHKIMNPEKMRSEYGKLMYMLMDSSDPTIQELLEFKCVRPLRTVARTLEDAGALGMLKDGLMHMATAEIIAGDRPRHEIQNDIKKKERARKELVRKYSNSHIDEEGLLQCLYSISDNNSYLLFNRDPVDKMIVYLQEYFKPGVVEQKFSLAINCGLSGARLTHNHERQYNYALQSLTLWSHIANDMFKLWYLCEQDLLSETTSYRLQDTGQGLNRVQQAPHIGRAMQGILRTCQTAIGGWVGSSVVHLGDHNVPNALMFIDKYTQVPRILNPVVLVVEELPRLYRDPHLRKYIDETFGGVENAKKTILCDFFKHAFDGSGADNFFDAGSCIDGRLTSAWNWCGKIEKKNYYHLFKVAGFVSFDGDFQK